MNDAQNRWTANRLCSAATHAAAAFSLAACSFGAPAQQDAAFPESAAGASELERAFWVCDYVATTRGVDATPIAHCSAVTDALKNERFGGDFSELLAWWQRNKPAEHAALARLDR